MYGREKLGEGASKFAGTYQDVQGKACPIFKLTALGKGGSKFGPIYRDVYGGEKPSGGGLSFQHIYRSARGFTLLAMSITGAKARKFKLKYIATGTPEETSRPMTATMSSLEVAELTGKRHRDVMRDIRTMLRDLGQGLSNFAQAYCHPQNGRSLLCFNLPRDLTFTLVTGYPIPLRQKVIDRWMELEKEVRKGPMHEASSPLRRSPRPYDWLMISARCLQSKFARWVDFLA